MPTTMGRRERKKAQTRRALAEAAVRLFAERGYDGVTVAQIADEADVSIATLFAHVPDGKDALIFDDGDERHVWLAAAVRERPEGQPVLEALRRCLAASGPFADDLPPELRRKRDLIVRTPALREYSRRLWIAGAEPLAEVIAAESGRDPSDLAVRALARYVLEIPELAGAEPDPKAALNAVFDLLESGWPGKA
ncbi:MAG: TetR family transcriptional regulator [Nonomuraea sp.]|nr:TetR family transcriptional regulator [Nonomuraea sp.]NUP65492.1 TetR family transcriptional regulator [Nonomuraea sp.]NUP77234.1 TetR family transcriptional regulator [Nonomuraea sp.]NUS03098.1 TetR family transcriptional regulator [Nonomuraea sp.]NUT10351.1 TetR family transcriptional regulator [Nonomuraea sp.]